MASKQPLNVSDDHRPQSVEEGWTAEMLETLQYLTERHAELPRSTLLYLQRRTLDATIRDCLDNGSLSHSQARRIVDLGVYTEDVLSIIYAPSIPSGLYPTLESYEVRLLTILSVEGIEVTCRLDTYPSWRAPAYDALSYCWGEDEGTTLITCNGVELEIRKNLHKALQYLLKDRCPSYRPLWIDAICLNQDDDEEKAVQVPRMGEIYRAATRTVVWLGEDVDDSGMALTFLEELTEETLGNIDSLLQEGTSSKETFDYQLASLTKLLNQPWFYRLWVVQEVILSQRISMRCLDVTGVRSGSSTEAASIAGILWHA